MGCFLRLTGIRVSSSIDRIRKPPLANVNGKWGGVGGLRVVFGGLTEAVLGACKWVKEEMAAVRALIG